MRSQGEVIIGRYELERELGRGGMGSVWRAFDRTLDAPCALKFVDWPPDVPRDSELGAELRSRFEREAKAAAKLRSPHVVQVFDHGDHEGCPFLAMELLEGESLAARIEREGRLAPRDVTTIVRDVARALAKAHAAGIVHRDLKPDNIWLTPGAERVIAKVLDFGIAKSEQALRTSSKTRTGAILGTPAYMSPEQIDGAAVDWRSDLWALGVLVHECLTGALPFEAESLGKLFVAILQSTTPSPRERVASLPASIDAFWARALQREPAARFQSAAEMAMALAEALEDDTEGAARSATVMPSPRLPAVTAAIPAATTATTPGPTFGGQTARSSLENGRSSGGRVLAIAAVAALTLGVAAWGTVHTLGSPPPGHSAHGATGDRGAPAAAASASPGEATTEPAPEPLAEPALPAPVSPTPATSAEAHVASAIAAPRTSSALPRPANGGAPSARPPASAAPAAAPTPAAPRDFGF